MAALGGDGAGPRPYEVTELALSADVKGQMASAVLTTRFRNLTRGTIEIDYLAPLPEGASVVSAVLVEEGKELMGKVYAKEEALRIYTETVAEMKDPALIEYAGKDTYRARIYPVPPGKTRTLELSMSFLVPKERGLCGISVPLAGPVTRRHAIGRQEVVVRFSDTPGLSNVYSPLPAVVTAREGAGGSARWEAENAGALDSFRLFYRTGSEGIGASLISHRPSLDEDGYFLFLAEPALDESARPLPKDVCFVLDISGSMCGSKFRQATEATRFILGKLAPEDRFGLIHFSTETGRWKDELAPMTAENRADAERYLSLLRDGGGTDIGTPLSMALDMMDGGRPAYVLFLTDGDANVGVTGEKELAGIIGTRNGASARIFSFGVGYDLNARLLERFSSVSGGSTTFVDETEDIEAKVSEFFSRITSPVLTSPEIKTSLPVNRTCPRRLRDLFAGGQISMVGRYPAGGECSFELAGLEGGERKSFSNAFELSDVPAPEASFLRTLWATRRSAQIMEELDLSSFTGAAGLRHRKELTDELVELARRYGVLTPFTSFLATEDLNLNDDSFDDVVGRLGLKDLTSGRDAVRWRHMRSMDADVVDVQPNAARFVEYANMDTKLASMEMDEEYDVMSVCRMSMSQAALAHPISESRLPGGGEDGAHLDFSRPDRRLKTLSATRSATHSNLRRSGTSRDDTGKGSGAPSGEMVPPETIGGRTFFLKDGVLVEGDLTEDELGGAKEVEQFSPEYFSLASEIPPEGLGWLSQEKPIVFRWKGAVYRVVPKPVEKRA
jgi:Ca-activated chloride channel family protein